MPRKIANNLQKLVNVIDVRIINNEPHVERDLALIKVRNNDAHSRNTLTEICDRYPARIVDVGPDVAIIEMVGTEDFIEKFIDEVRPIGIVEMIRTGVVTMGRGTRIHDTTRHAARIGARHSGSSRRRQRQNYLRTRIQRQNCSIANQERPTAWQHSTTTRTLI